MSIVKQFKGRPVAAITYKGRPCFVASQIGAAVGYERDGLRFVNQITGPWSKDLIEGIDYLKVEGEDFAALAGSLAHTDPVSAKARHMILLFESGVHLALMKTNKPAGRKLRRWLADEVLPQITQTGAYQPALALPEAGKGRRVLIEGKCIVRHDFGVVVSGEDRNRGNWIVTLPPALARGADDEEQTKVYITLRIEDVRVHGVGPKKQARLAQESATA